jgi:hypothetical protein
MILKIILTGVFMSVRATDRLIADVVVASGLGNSPRMIVKSVNPEEKLVTTLWFSDSKEMQQGIFPASALDRAETPVAPVKERKESEKITKKTKPEEPAKKSSRRA